MEGEEREQRRKSEKMVGVGCLALPSTLVTAIVLTPIYMCVSSGSSFGDLSKSG